LPKKRKYQTNLVKGKRIPVSTGKKFCGGKDGKIEPGLPISELATPAILVDLDMLEKNIQEAGDIARKNKKEIWPMVKTHKSLEIAKMQSKAGASGYLCGTIDEAEMLIDKGGFKQIMLAYPVADKQNLKRCINLIKKAELIFRVDSEETASLMNEACKQVGKTTGYVIKIDAGLHRFGVEPKNAGKFARSLQRYKNLRLLGIATHSGLVYSAQNSKEVKKIALQGLECLHIAYKDLRRFDYDLKMITVGSTPSFQYDIKDDLVTHVHPGNYVYYDAMQVFLGTVSLERCALTVLVTVTSRHKEQDSASLNAGVKIFSRDTGGHEIKVVKGYGVVKEYPKAIFKGLSEEVGLLDVKGEPGMKVGEKIQIIPNHSCVVNNNTSYLIGHRGGVVERLIPVDARVGI